MQRLQQSLRKVNPFRWILFLWICLIYLWAIRSMFQEQLHPSYIFVFTVGTLLYFGVYGVGLFLSTTTSLYRFLYFVAQALLILLISLISNRFAMVLALYLALVADVASTLLKMRMAWLIGAVCLVLVSFSLSLELFYGWDYVLSILMRFVFLYVMPVCLLVIGYALLFTRQARAHAQTQTLLHELERAHQQLADSSTRIEELTRLAERQRLARELHDTLAQGLAGLILQLEAVKSHLVNRRHERALEIVTQAMGRARTSLAAARSAIDDLRTGDVTLRDLQHALEIEIARFTASTGIPCTTQLASLSLVPEALYEDIVRLVAEGLLNVARHAQARRVWVCVAQQGLALNIEVRDDGIGFDPAAVDQRGHYGLSGLRERTCLLGGHFVLMSTPGKGASLHFLLPVMRREEAS